MSTPEINLWKEIIYTIFDDADRDIKSAMTPGFLDLQLSKRLYETESRWFISMCSMVEIHEDYIRRALIQRYEQAKKDLRFRLQHQETSNSSVTPE